MKILAIETSCDETAVSIIETTGNANLPRVNILAQVITSQLAIHAHWGGVVPNIAKREHQKALIPLLIQALGETDIKSIVPSTECRVNSKSAEIKKILEREAELLPEFLKFIESVEIPDIDAIAVTQGPGLEPALWVGINCARALSLAWEKPLIPVNHMEGHFVAALLPMSQKSVKSIKSESKLREIKYPAVALLVSGGHTELVLSEKQRSYKILGQTRDDAVGEAFDKVARILGLPYPGGPAISKLADIRKSHFLAEERLRHLNTLTLPRPMMKSGDYDFSFSGLKTAVLYLVRDLGGIDKVDNNTRATIAHEFQEAALEVLVSKTMAAAKEYGAQTIIVGGGVSANKKLREKFDVTMSHFRTEERHLDGGIRVLFPAPGLSTDNATMIALAGYFRYLDQEVLRPGSEIVASGTLSL